MEGERSFPSRPGNIVGGNEWPFVLRPTGGQYGANAPLVVPYAFVRTRAGLRAVAVAAKAAASTGLLRRLRLRSARHGEWDRPGAVHLPRVRPRELLRADIDNARRLTQGPFYRLRASEDRLLWSQRQEAKEPRSQDGS